MNCDHGKSISHEADFAVESTLYLVGILPVKCQNLCGGRVPVSYGISPIRRVESRPNRWSGISIFKHSAGSRTLLISTLKPLP